jgi:hypothetical protein
MEAFRQFGNGLIAPGAHGVNDALGLLLDGGIEQAGGSQQAIDLTAKIRVAVGEHIHAAGKIAEEGSSIKVKLDRS